MARALLVVVVAVGVIASCQPPEKREEPGVEINRVTDALVAALAAKDERALADLVDDDYQDNAKRSKRDVEQLASAIFQNGPVYVATGDPELIVEDLDHASYIVHLVAANRAVPPTSAKELAPPNGRALYLGITLRRAGNRITNFRHDGRWKITAFNDFNAPKVVSPP